MLVPEDISHAACAADKTRNLQDNTRELWKTVKYMRFPRMSQMDIYQCN